MKNSKIGWTDHTWNPVTGCTQVSPGCDHCYALAIAEQYRGTPAFPNGFDVQLRQHRLLEPYKWKTPSRIFVNSMSDLFHKEIPDSYLIQIWGIMEGADWHTFQVLTKRPHRMAQKIKDLGLPTLPNLWLGVSVENQMYAENRIPSLLSIPGDFVRWISAEPLLGPLNLIPWLLDLRWVVDGGESGPGRRPAEVAWFRSIKDQCLGSRVPYLHKQGNANRPGEDRVLDGRTWDEYPRTTYERSREEQGVLL